jgi:hypothetical protein
MNTRSFLLSALIAGVVIGFLGNLPVLNLINCCLCIWVWVGGALAVYLYKRYQREASGLSLAQGAGLGALSGLIGVFVGMVVFLVTSSLSLPLFDALARFVELGSDSPFRTGGFGGVLVQALIFFVLDLVLYPIFGALGALIATSLFWKK